MRLTRALESRASAYEGCFFFKALTSNSVQLVSGGSGEASCVWLDRHGYESRHKEPLRSTVYRASIKSRPRGMMGNPLRQPLEIGEPQRLVRPSSIGPSNDANNNISKQNKVNDIFVFECWILSMTSMPTLVSRQSRTW